MPARRLLSILFVSVLVVASCSDDGGVDDAAIDDGTTTTDPPVTGSTAPPAPADVVVTGPVAGAPQTSGASGLDEAGYVEEEYFVSGTAVRFEPDGPLEDDGRWSVTEGEAAPFTTRILVKRPVDPGDASGVVVVEWNNVSAGADGTPDWSYTSAELLRSGHVHVGVSAQAAGIDGEVGGGLGGFGTPLVPADPERYGDLSHPGDPYSYDIFRLVGRLVRGGATDGPDPLDEIPVAHVLAVGESQSAFRLTTYVNAVHPLDDEVFDGFLVHSRGGGAAPLDDGEGLASGVAGSVLLRDDLAAPALVFSTETDLTVLGYRNARQPDGDSIVGWEVAGTAHADAFLLGGDPAVGEALGCSGPINDGPQHVALKAAMAALVDWVVDGDPPAPSPRIEIEGDAIVRDDDGLAVGGIRLPAVEVPFASLSGDPRPGSGVLCSLFGSTEAFSPADMSARYGTSDGYVAQVDDAYDDAVAAGFALEADRDAVLTEARSVPFG